MLLNTSVNNELVKITGLLKIDFVDLIRRIKKRYLQKLVWVNLINR